MQNERKMISRDELNRIYSLPKQSFVIYGKKTDGLFDEAQNRFYLLTSDGKLTGKMAVISQQTSAPNSAQTQDREPHNQTEGQNEGSPSNSKNGEEFADQCSNNVGFDSAQPGNSFFTDKRKVRAVVVLAVVAIVAIVIVLKPIRNNLGSSSATTASSTVQGTVASKVDVIQVTADLVPGDQITKNDVAKTTISSDTYNQIILGGATVCPWDQLESVIGKYATAYIQAGRYISASSIATSYKPASNPWIVDQSGYQYVTLALDPNAEKSSNLNFGAIANIDLTKTVSTSATPTNGSATSDQSVIHKGSETKSVTTDTYSLPSVVICDILNDQTKSIYDVYTQIMAVPADKQVAYLSQELKTVQGLQTYLQPAYVKVRVTNAQASAIGNIDSGTAVTFEITQAAEMATQAQTNYVTSAKTVSTNLANALKLNLSAK